MSESNQGHEVSAQADDASFVDTTPEPFNNRPPYRGSRGRTFTNSANQRRNNYSRDNGSRQSSGGSGLYDEGRSKPWKYQDKRTHRNSYSQDEHDRSRSGDWRQESKEFRGRNSSSGYSTQASESVHSYKGGSGQPDNQGESEVQQGTYSHGNSHGNSKRHRKNRRGGRRGTNDHQASASTNPQLPQADISEEHLDSVSEAVTILNPTAMEFTPGLACNSAPSAGINVSDEFDMHDEYAPEARTSQSNESIQLNSSGAEVTTTSCQDTSFDSSWDSGKNTYVSPNTSGKLQGSKYKRTSNVSPNLSDISLNENSSRKSTPFEIFEKKYRSLRQNMQYAIVEEIQGDLFEMDDSYALGNCVASDFNMGSGIAVNFRQMFKNVEELLAQRQSPGGLAVLHFEGRRFIYYLVTKKESSKKPTYETLFRSLEKLREHMVANEVNKLAVPRLGCGLDRLEWDRVKVMLEYVFTGTEVKITVCNYQKADDSMNRSKDDLQHRKCPVAHVRESIANVTPYSIVLYLGTVNGDVDDQFKAIDARFRIARDYQNKPREMGGTVLTTLENYKYYIVGCIVRENCGAPVDFEKFGKCVKDINRENNKFRKNGEQYEHVAIQNYHHRDDELLMTKLTNLMKNTFFKCTVTIYE